MDSAIATPLGPGDPQDIGPFKIIGLLGSGAMGEVYLGTTEERYVAVKRMRARIVSSERFQREISILYRVPAGVAPGVLASDSTAARPWFAAEYVPGITVDDAVELHGPLPSDALWLLLAETAARLQAVHAVDIVHRDLKPGNVMLVREGVKLIDFGIARAADLARLTRGGGSYGTLGFAAPEQEAGNPDVASSADVYALGALLLYAASGLTPSASPDIESVRAVDPAVASVIESCLVAAPEERPTAAELVETARDYVLTLDPSWPAEAMKRIRRREKFVATPVHKMETVPPPPDLGTGRASTTSQAEQKHAEQSRQHRRRLAASEEAWLHPAAESLAGKVQKQWEKEERLRHVHDPYPLPVRFEVAESGLFDHWANIRRTGRGTDPGPLPLAGELDEIAGIYESIPSERLVVLGEAGSGKTILALRFVLDRLSDYEPGDRVPVIFSLGSWDPTAVSLHDWMCRRLVRDYNALGAAVEGGGNMAVALVDRQQILPVLDGFDEVAPGLQGAALKALNYYTEPLLLTSRPADFGRAVEENDVLTAAACIELETLALRDLDEYLTRASRPGAGSAARTVWEPVLSKLRVREKSRGVANVVGTLTTPLMVALARTVYSDTPGRDPSELVDTEKFSTAEDVQEHLLAEFVPAVYRQMPSESDAVPVPGMRRPRRWDQDRAQHWLGYLAWHMEEQGDRDLAWWELGTVLRPRSLMLVLGLAVAAACGLVAGVVYGTAGWIAHGMAHGIESGVVNGILNALGVGLTFGLMHGFVMTMKSGGPVFEPSHMGIRLRRGTRLKLRDSFLPRVWGGLIGGVLFGVIWVVGGGFFGAIFPSKSGPALAVAARDDFLLGVGLGVAVGVVAGIGAGLEAVSEKEKAARPSDLLNKNRNNVLTQVLAVAVVIGVGYGLVLGPAPGIAAGLMVGFGLGTMTAWGRWVVLARIWLPLRGQVPWSLIAFLEDAYHRGVLRQAGAVYQFRHARVQTQLAEWYQDSSRTDRHEEG